MKIVQIGTGGWGKNHTRILSQLGVLVAVCDADKERSSNVHFIPPNIIIANHNTSF